MSTKFRNVLCYNISAIQIRLNAVLYLLVFHVFHLKIILHHLGNPFPHEDGFNKVKNSDTKSAYCSTCDDYGGNADEIWVNGDWFYIS